MNLIDLFLLGAVVMIVFLLGVRIVGEQNTVIKCAYDLPLEQRVSCYHGCQFGTGQIFGKNIPENDEGYHLCISYCENRYPDVNITLI